MPVVYLLPGLAAAALLGWSHQVKVENPRAGKFVPGLAGVFLTAVLLFSSARTVADGFVRWAQAQETRLEHYQSVLLDMSRYFKANPAAALVIADGFYEPIDRDSFRRDLGFDPAARWVQTGGQAAGAVVLPAREVGEDGRFYVPEFAPVNLALLAAAGISAQPLYRSAAWPSFAVYDLPMASNVPRLAEPVFFEGGMVLEGYEILTTEPQATLQLVTSWRVHGALPADLVIFVHIVDGNGNVMAQHDGLDAAAAELRPGDHVIQLHTVTLPELSGPVDVEVGLYRRGNGARLHREGTLEDTVTLTRIE